jgi:peptidoglycan/LPS O-acetylase OafA/YrhL
VTTLSRYWKIVQFVVLAIGGAFAVAIRDGHITGQETANLVVLAAGALVLFWKKNTPTQPWAKTAVAVFTVGVSAVVAAWTDSVITIDEWVQIFLAVVGAVGVATVANVPPGPQPEAPVTPLDARRDAGAVE